MGVFLHLKSPETGEELLKPREHGKISNFSTEGTFLGIYIHTYIHAYIYTYGFLLTSVQKYMCTNIYNVCTHTYIQTYVCLYVC